MYPSFFGNFLVIRNKQSRTKYEGVKHFTPTPVSHLRVFSSTHNKRVAIVREQQRWRIDRCCCFSAVCWWIQNSLRTLHGYHECARVRCATANNSTEIHTRGYDRAVHAFPPPPSPPPCSRRPRMREPPHPPTPHIPRNRLHPRIPPRPRSARHVQFLGLHWQRGPVVPVRAAGLPLLPAQHTSKGEGAGACACVADTLILSDIYRTCQWCICTAGWVALAAI